MRITRRPLHSNFSGLTSIFVPSEIETIVFLDLPMLLRSFKLFTAAWLTLLLLVACGGGSAAPAATGLTAKPTESTVTVSWDMAPNVEYWLFSGPTSNAPTSTADMSTWINSVGFTTKTNVTSPYVVTGLVNGTSYTVSVNGRTSGGPGGPGATPVAATPMLAGSTWSVGAAAGSNALRSVMFGASYVAAGDNGAMYSSLDGATWSAINYATSINLNGASYFGTYKLVGDTGLVLVSSDAVTWTPQTSSTPQNLYAIASNNVNLNVAVGANGSIITSPDGLTWTPATLSPNTTNPLYGVAYSTYNGGTWVAVGAAGTMYESADGVNWHSVTLTASTDLHGITYGASAFVAVGSSGTILSSVDGVVWTAQVSPAAVDLKAITYGTQFVEVGAGGNVFISTDALTWTASSATGTTNDLYAVVRGSLADVAVGAAGTNLLAK